MLPSFYGSAGPVDLSLREKGLRITRTRGDNNPNVCLRLIAPGKPNPEYIELLEYLKGKVSEALVSPALLHPYWAISLGSLCCGIKYSLPLGYLIKPTGLWISTCNGLVSPDQGLKGYGYHAEGQIHFILAPDQTIS